MDSLFSTTRSRREAKADLSALRVLEPVLARCLSKLAVGRIAVEFPSGKRQTYGVAQGSPSALLKIRDLRTVLRMILSGELGMAEGYMAGEWDTPDLTALFTLAEQNADALSNALSAGWIAKWRNRAIHAGRANTRSGSRRNIAAHYDLGNDFYRLWLDGGMTYSAALFADNEESLEAAQRRKYLRIAAQLDLRPGDRVLEIGCGWGGFAEIAAAEFGCEVVGLTLSEAQARYARARMRRAGLADRVDIRLQDYRDIDGRFNKVASIEMFEAVGEENWPTYFQTLERCLDRGGRAALQIITIANEHFGSYRRNPDFIQRYIFPGGMLPSPAAFEKSVEAAGFRIADSSFFGRSYAETLRRWSSAFEANWPAIAQRGFDERFHRMWRYYLSYCEVGFESDRVDVGHFLLDRR
ncbi:MAG TPA: cyclopropane-fatty-acyl-phospholipid synthase family protein [Kiloniellaceae bacterium]|nr:cyclopropane-fatty-acyl-phospholipid synthase family protein [Kiloniellaceae bacterium]